MQFFCLFQTQCPQCRLRYLSYGYQGRHSAQGLDSYGFLKWKDRPRQDYSSALPQWLFQWLDTYTVFGGGGGAPGAVSLLSALFFGQCLHKSSSSTICLLPRSLESGREQWDIFHVARSQVGPQYNASLLHWLHVSGVSGQCFALYTKSAKNNHPYHFTYINTQPVKYYQVKHTGAEYDWSNPTSPVS